MKVSDLSAGKETCGSPNLRKLKQARLPFQIIRSDTSASLSPAPKKRKLSDSQDETRLKVGKISEQKENDVLEDKCDLNNSIVISDDDDGVDEDNVVDSKESNVVLNPYVPIVDVALKRKLRKRKSPNKSKAAKSTTVATKKSKLSKEPKELVDDNISENKDVKKSKIDVGKALETKVLERESSCETKENIKGIDDLNESKGSVVSLIDNTEAGDLKTPSRRKSGRKVEFVTLKRNTNDDKIINNVKASESNAKTSGHVYEILDVDEIEEKKIPEIKSSDICEESIKAVDDLNESKDSIVSSLDGNQKTPSRRRSDRKVEFVTPKSNKKDGTSGNDTDKSTESPLNSSIDMKKLTPKQLQKKLESIKKQQEREKEKQEREQKRLEEKEEKNKQRLEKEEQKRKEREEKERVKEEEKKLKEQKEEEKRKEKEEKELQKKREKEMKEEEKRKKEEEREEEKRLKEEEKRLKELEKEEAENKKKKAAAAFANFFVPKEKLATEKICSENQLPDVVKRNEHLSNFRVKLDMRLAPLTRDQLNTERKEVLESFLTKQESGKKNLYVNRLKKKDYIAKTSGKTWPLADLDDVEIIEDDLPPMDESNIILPDSHRNQNLRPKFLSFDENRRPAYWGTWRRKSKHISGRRPFGMDQTHLDYSCDSDDEWEEEEPGESVGGSIAGSVDDDGENEYLVDNEFMVPHGYLSEEEATSREDEDDKVFSPETQLAKLKSLECEFENERKKTTERLHPRLIGIIWQNSEGSKPGTCAEAVWNFLSFRKALSVDSQIFIKPSADSTESELDDTLKNINSDKNSTKKARKITEEMIPDLIKLIHGNTNSRGFLANEFQTFISKSTPNDSIAEAGEEKQIPQNEISKVSIARKIKEISQWKSCPEEGAMHAKTCWYVEKDIRDKYNVGDLELPTKWIYTLTPKRKDARKVKCATPQEKVAQEQNRSSTKEDLSMKKDRAFNITKFTKQLTQEEREKQFVSLMPAATLSVNGTDSVINTKHEGNKNTQNTNVTSSPLASTEKKRVPLLFSGPRGKSLPSSQTKSDDNKDEAKLNDVNTSENTKGMEVQNDKTNSNKKSLNKPEEKKRVPLLVSVPRGQPIPKTIKTNLLTQFVKTVAHTDKSKQKTNANSPKSNIQKVTPMETDDFVVLSD